jgi:hypothetical protein
MNGIGDYLTAVLADLATIPGLRSVAGHGGTFTLEDVKRISVEAPCLRVAITGCEPAKRGSDGQSVLPLNVAVVIVAKDQAQQGVGRTTRDVAALALASAVLLRVAGNRFDLSGVSQPEDLRAANEYSGSLDNTGVALWQVTWRQAIGLGPVDADVIPALSQLWINDELFTAGADPVSAPLAPAFAQTPPNLPINGREATS